MLTPLAEAGYKIRQAPGIISSGLGLKAHLKRPAVAELLPEQYKEWVPTDGSPRLVYYSPRRM